MKTWSDPTRAVNAISNRLSLRRPQRDSLEILSRLGEILPLEKGQDLNACLEIVKSEFPSVEEFERDFPSLCFTLATGVGKTRLMGAFIAYLHEVHQFQHFFVLAPTLTIYNKLVTEFREPNHPKYIFKGLPEFAVRGVGLVTGDNYEQTNIRGLEQMYPVIVSVFNASKITEGEREAGGLKFRRPWEVLGQSYSDYLANLDDLVIIMDESHRYRAKGAMRAINDLKPVLGLELTATPKVAGAGGKPFKNVIYSYPLSSAMSDGFVKDPAVVTKENFRPQDYKPDELELVKLEDGVRVHEHTKVELETYSLQTGKPLVRPFMLVVAQDTSHADELQALIKSDRFFEGRYADKVITVHSNQTGELKDDAVERLLVVEKADSDRAPEIVIHVNKLGEGWDVSNLYTIVPLRRFVADILTEQTLGRGLRLPYGRRTGNEAVDTLHIIAHDKFQAIVDEARNPGSIIKKGVVIGRDIPTERKVVVTVPPAFMPPTNSSSAEPEQEKLAFYTPTEEKIATVAVEVVRQYEYLPRSADLKKPEVREKFAEQVRGALMYKPVGQQTLDGTEEPESKIEPEVVEKAVDKFIDRFIEKSIDVPRIVLQPKGETAIRFKDFDLDVSGVNYQPVSADLLVELLSTGKRWKLAGGESINVEQRLENYIVRGLVDKSDIDYATHADLLYKLASQVVNRLKSYLTIEDDIVKVLVHHQRSLVELVYAQMQQHRSVSQVDYEVHVSKGFETLRSNSFDAFATETSRDFRHSVDDKLLIRGMSFGGFAKCLYPVQKFQSDAERRLAVILENDSTVLKWFKPAPGQFRIHLASGDYEPDFVVETDTEKYLMEPKRSDLLHDPDVLAKADAAVKWCKHATDHELAHGGKPWRYLLIPDNGINSTVTVGGLSATYSKS